VDQCWGFLRRLSQLAQMIGPRMLGTPSREWGGQFPFAVSHFS